MTRDQIRDRPPRPGPRSLAISEPSPGTVRGELVTPMPDEEDRHPAAVLQPGLFLEVAGPREESLVEMSALGCRPALAGLSWLASMLPRFRS
jgi:hypothetical protein